MNAALIMVDVIHCRIAPIQWVQESVRNASLYAFDSQHPILVSADPRFLCHRASLVTVTPPVRILTNVPPIMAGVVLTCVSIISVHANAPSLSSPERCFGWTTPQGRRPHHSCLPTHKDRHGSSSVFIPDRIK